MLSRAKCNWAQHSIYFYISLTFLFVYVDCNTRLIDFLCYLYVDSRLNDFMQSLQRLKEEKLAQLESSTYRNTSTLSWHITTSSGLTEILKTNCWNLKTSVLTYIKFEALHGEVSMYIPFAVAPCVYPLYCVDFCSLQTWSCFLFYWGIWETTQFWKELSCLWTTTWA